MTILKAKRLWADVSVLKPTQELSKRRRSGVFWKLPSAASQVFMDLYGTRNHSVEVQRHLGLEV